MNQNTVRKNLLEDADKDVTSATAATSTLFSRLAPPPQSDYRQSKLPMWKMAHHLMLHEWGAWVEALPPVMRGELRGYVSALLSVALGEGEGDVGVEQWKELVTRFGPLDTNFLGRLRADLIDT